MVNELEEGDTIRRVSIERQGKDATAFDLTFHLKELEQSARYAEREARESAQRKADRSIDPCRRAELPKRTGKTDPARVPAENQPEDEKIALEYLLVSHNRAVPRMGNPACEKQEAAEDR